MCVDGDRLCGNSGRSNGGTVVVEMKAAAVAVVAVAAAAVSAATVHRVALAREGGWWCKRDSYCRE